MDVVIGTRVSYGHSMPLSVIMRLKCDNVAKVLAIVVLWLNRLRTEQKSHTQDFFCIKMSYMTTEVIKNLFQISTSETYAMIDIHRTKKIQTKKKYKTKSKQKNNQYRPCDGELSTCSPTSSYI